MKVLLATFECVPFIKVGGLADVAGTLPKFLEKKKVDIRIILPLHKGIDRDKFRIKNLGRKFLVPGADGIEEARLWALNSGGITVYFIENEKYFGRDSIYGDAGGDYADNSRRIIFFSRAVLEACKSIDFKPDIIHCNDMQTGLIPAYLKTLYRTDAFFSDTSTVYTIHNIAYQGIYPSEMHYRAGFGSEDFNMEKMEYYGNINFMKSGIVYSDIVNTVSPTYAKEIQLSGEQGKGLEGILARRSKDVYGILNGIDCVEWDPQNDGLIKANFSEKDPEGKSGCKADLQRTCKLPEINVPVIGMVSRLDPLKGFDLVLDIFPSVISGPLQMVILGKGSREFEEILRGLSLRYPDKLHVSSNFDNNLAHKIYAGSDIFLMPSRTEPCGLSQLIAMRYGTVPLVHKTGGLADTVKSFDAVSKQGTGFIFDSPEPKALLNTFRSAIELYSKNPAAWKILVKNDLKQDFSWDTSVNEYMKVYKLAKKRHEVIE